MVVECAGVQIASLPIRNINQNSNFPNPVQFVDVVRAGWKLSSRCRCFTCWRNMTLLLYNYYVWLLFNRPIFPELPQVRPLNCWELIMISVVRKNSMLMMMMVCASRNYQKTDFSGRRWRSAASNVERSVVSCWSVSVRSTVLQRTSGRTRPPATLSVSPVRRRPPRCTSPVSELHCCCYYYDPMWCNVNFSRYSHWFSRSFIHLFESEYYYRTQRSVEKKTDGRNSRKKRSVEINNQDWLNYSILM